MILLAFHYYPTIKGKTRFSLGNVEQLGANKVGWSTCGDSGSLLGGELELRLGWVEEVCPDLCLENPVGENTNVVVNTSLVDNPSIKDSLSIPLTSKQLLAGKALIIVEKNVSDSSVDEGDSITVTVTLKNVGLDEATTITAEDEVLESFEYEWGATYWRGSLGVGESISYSYGLEANDHGSETLPPTKVTYTDRTGTHQVYSNHLEIDIDKEKEKKRVKLGLPFMGPIQGFTVPWPQSKNLSVTPREGRTTWDNPKRGKCGEERRQGNRGGLCKPSCAHRKVCFPQTGFPRWGYPGSGGAHQPWTKGDIQHPTL